MRSSRRSTVAIVGATEKEDSVGRTLLWNLISNPFGGTVYPVNPKRPNVLGIRAYPQLSDVPEQIDLAVIVTPAPTVPSIIEECVEGGCRGAIIISAGFKEIGPEGAALEREILVHRPAGENAHHRPQLPGRDEPTHRPERHFRQGHGAARRRRLRQPERRPLHVRAGLEPPGSGWFQRLPLHRVDAGRRLGRPPLSTWATTIVRRPSSCIWRRWAMRGASSPPHAKWRWRSRSSSSRRAARRRRRRRPRRIPARWPAATTYWMPPSAGRVCCGWTTSPTSSTWPRSWRNNPVRRVPTSPS